MFTISSQWIHQHITPKGAWTRAQLEVIGVAWPPRNGWIRSIEGQQITEEQRDEFESNVTVTAKIRRQQLLDVYNEREPGQRPRYVWSRRRIHIATVSGTLCGSDLARPHHSDEFPAGRAACYTCLQLYGIQIRS